jgi:hypothetical protein
LFLYNSIIINALKLFLDGKKPLDVAIELDIKADEVNKLYRKYWELNQLHQLTVLYQKIKDHIPSFLRLHSIIRDNEMGDDEIVNVLKYANELRSLKDKVQQLACDVVALVDKRNSCKTDLVVLQNQVDNKYHTKTL